MHPILARPGRLNPYLAACMPLAAILTALLARPGGGIRIYEAVAMAVPLTCAYAFMGLSVWYVCRQFRFRGAGLLRAAGVHAVAALLTSCLWVGFAALLAAAWGLWSPFDGLLARLRPQGLALFAVGILLYVLAAALNYVLLALAAAAEAERREAELVLLARDAELAALKAQVRPHFLFNSLNAISGLAASEPEKAREMCVRLADFLRRSLAVGERPSIPVSEELALSRAYLSVEALRFGARLTVEEDLDERGDPCLVPPLLLQPLVENAVRHGIASCVDGGTVRVGVRCAAGRLRIMVENPLDPESPPRPGGGLGLANVRRRLEARWGGEALFAARRVDDRYLVVISVPAERAA
jgi:sensor histidine kinase YesM